MTTARVVVQNKQWEGGENALLFPECTIVPDPVSRPGNSHSHVLPAFLNFAFYVGEYVLSFTVSGVCVCVCVCVCVWEYVFFFTVSGVCVCVGICVLLYCEWCVCVCVCVCVCESECVCVRVWMSVCV